MQLTDWLLVEVELLLIDLTKIALRQSGFDHPFELKDRYNISLMLEVGS
jgi:hypothetical protein